MCTKEWCIYSKFHSLPVAFFAAFSHDICQCWRSEVNVVIYLQSVDVPYVWCHDSAVFVAFFSFILNSFDIICSGVEAMSIVLL
jgi:hypothetical protein